MNKKDVVELGKRIAYTMMNNLLDNLIENLKINGEPSRKFFCSESKLNNKG